MGNSNTKESRGDGADGSDARRNDGRPRRMSRGDLGHLLNLQSNSRERDRPDVPFERRETRQEREARRLERERVARAKERERSMREEHIDGGYLVTLGTYTGPEDFSKPVVRQLQIERKVAPFWRGLNDWSESWAEHQLVAAARGLPIPAADAPPDPELMPRPVPPASASTQNLNNLTVPLGPRTMSAASDRSESAAGSNLPSPTGATKSSSIKPRAKALAAALSVSSRNASSTDLAPKETMLPHDPFVNGQPIEVYLYKDASECPICFLSYPPYLNRTRCCDQPICSECFVQIKRSDPHLPEHHPDGEVRDPNEALNPEDPPEMLISEAAACPYCQQPEFGVTYEPPPFRRGLVYTASSSNFGSTAMSSQSSLNSTLPPTSPQQHGRRRTHSLSATAPGVITTDRVRPDWATKLASARAHQARRAAAATALHTAAFLVGGTEQRSLLRGGRFGRRNTGSNGTSTPGPENSSSAIGGADGLEPGERGSSAGNADGTRRTRMEELEEMMFMEAVRLSLASEEERKRKEEKAIRKETKKRQQAERKAQKKQAKDPYGGGLSGASGSSLSLGLGRRRGNSAASNLRMEVTVQGASQSPRGDESPSSEHEDRGENGAGKGKGVDRGPSEPTTPATSQGTSLPIPTASPRGGSHLRQMSNASSLGSSLADTPSGSYTGAGFVGPEGNASSRQGRSDDGDGNEPLFNFRSLAELVGVNIDDGSAQAGTSESAESPQGAHDGSGRPLSQVKEDEKEEAEAEHVEACETERPYAVAAENDEDLEKTITLPPQVTLGPEMSSGSNKSTEAENSRRIMLSPEVTLTPETPVPEDDSATENKQLGHANIMEHATSIAQ
ncbi:C2H2 zinc finger protein [Purpureocillium lavendulum]|uniref:C2H2 zinc finger protein n=1 Tax=Purpureocillium lavendulum TaxID=1247861 RepID=A0AB34FLQ1_9HYPO|nr:C2H2 zinc finger protein [Purpureocillium lavendulum]